MFFEIRLRPFLFSQSMLREDFW